MPKFTIVKPIVLLILVLFCTSLSAQNATLRNRSSDATTMVLEGRVIDANNKGISNVNVLGPNGRYATTGFDGKFKIPANLGDEIVFNSIDFETVYYRVNSKDEVEIRVENKDNDQKAIQKLSYKTALDSVQTVMRSKPIAAADILIKLLTDSSIKLSNEEKANAYEKLGDVYTINKQHDLANSNYLQAIKLSSSSTRKTKQADALLSNGNYQEAIKSFESMLVYSKKSNLNANTRIKVLTSLGDAYAATNNKTKALARYNDALSIAKSSRASGDISGISIKIASILSKSGNLEGVAGYLNTALSESKKESPVVNAIVQSQTADLFNSNGDFDKEIALRKSNIKILENAIKEKRVIADPVRSEITVSNNSIKYEKQGSENAEEISIQKEQFKIGTALQAQNKTVEAISFFKQSIAESTANNDLAIKKEAAKELASLFKEQGDQQQASFYTEVYSKTLDALFTQKEQQLALATRDAKELINNQTRILTLEKDRELNAKKVLLYDTQQELYSQTTKRQQLIIYSLVALAFLFCGLLYFMYRNNKQQKINNQLLALKSLRSQMNPHFIFNALNSVNSYIANSDERAANKYLADFSRLMRNVLDNSELDFIPLTKELELLELYVKLEHERFKDKFDYNITVDPSVASQDLKVPPMLLQPVIENAIWHGLRYKKEKGFLNISFDILKNSSVITKLDKNKYSNALVVTITDNGIGRKLSKELKTANQKKQESKGLGNVANRLELLNNLHKHHITMQVADAGLLPDTGTTVVVTIS